jgi:hypothetical protein
MKEIWDEIKANIATDLIGLALKIHFKASYDLAKNLGDLTPPGPVKWPKT